MGIIKPTYKDVAQLAVMLSLAERKASISNFDRAHYLLSEGLIMPPVRLGQTVWRTINKEVMECVIDEISVKPDSTYIGVKSKNGMYRLMFNAETINVKDIYTEEEYALTQASLHISSTTSV